MRSPGSTSRPALARGRPIRASAEPLHPSFPASDTSFPLVAGFWAQAERLSLAALLGGLAATALSLTQRSLSTDARLIRRTALPVAMTIGDEVWPRERLIDSWERPLKLLTATVLLLAAALLALHV